MKNDKEIIDEIIYRLKSKKEPEYKPGSWENFKKTHPTHSSRKMNVWYAAASVLVILGLSFAMWQMNLQDKSVSTGSHQQTMTPHNVPTMRKNESLADISTDKVQAGENGDAVAWIQKQNLNVQNTDNFSASNIQPPVITQHEFMIFDKPIVLPELKRITERPITLSHTAINSKNLQPTLSPMVLATSGLTLSQTSMKEIEPLDQNKKFKFNDHFELGLFVSPNSTDKKLNVGAGFSVAYNLTKKLSVRTGLAYNSYEVNTLKDPISTSSTEVVMTNSSAALDASPSMSYQKQMIIPNINAITGFVKALDIPLELKMKARKSYYATAGVSYSAILNQKREAHYIENLNTETFAKGYPENTEEAENNMKVVTRTVASNEKNVKTNGFGGFVNFSVGKEVRFNNKLGISVEPYLKIPVGQFRRADMDYTNGGIKIMTNF